MTGTGRGLWLGCIAAATLLAACASTSSTTSTTTSVVGVKDAHLQADYWVRRDAEARKLVLTSSAIAAQNAKLRQLDPSVHDIEALPASLGAEEVRGWI